ncbi:MAG: hypothetical protein ACK4TG_00975, partial [Thermaurantiacus sp.]
MDEEPPIRPIPPEPRERGRGREARAPPRARALREEGRVEIPIGVELVAGPEAAEAMAVPARRPA